MDRTGQLIWKDIIKIANMMYSDCKMSETLHFTVLKGINKQRYITITEKEMTFTEMLKVIVINKNRCWLKYRHKVSNNQHEF